jgi:uncharacterized protein
MNSYEMILFFIAIILAFWAEFKVNGSYAKYSRIANQKGFTGQQIAQSILVSKGYNDVDIQLANGRMSDHFDPRSNAVRLSPEVFNGNSIAAAAIAAHEVGHVIQHREQYAGIMVRDMLLPLALTAGKTSFIVILLGFIMSSSFLINIGIAMMAITALFQFVTLPIEFDASARALSILTGDGYIYQEQRHHVKEMLNSAAFTYVAALFVTILQIMRLLSMSRRK